MKATDVKQILENILCEVVSAPATYVYEPQKNFSRTRKLPLYTVIKMLIGMGGNSLGKELLEWFGYSEKTVSVSAFVQQRNKIKPETLKHIFQTMVSQCDKHTLYNGYRLLAIDGSDLRLPSDKRESFSYIQNDETTKGYNLGVSQRDISNISSTRRNPVLADIFGRLGYMERQGSGFKKITESYHAAHNYRKELEPEFYSDVTSFQVTLYNLNYSTTINSANVTIADESVAITTDYVAIEAAIDGLNASQATIKKAKEVYKNMGTDGIFGRSDVSSITGDSVTAAGNLISKLKAASLIVPVKGYGKGKYRFIEPHK